VATAALAVFAILTTIYAVRAFRKQSQEVSEQAEMLKVQSEQLAEQRKVNSGTRRTSWRTSPRSARWRTKCSSTGTRHTSAVEQIPRHPGGPVTRWPGFRLVATSH
jgi:hypothetical protein